MTVVMEIVNPAYARRIESLGTIAVLRIPKEYQVGRVMVTWNHNITLIG